MRKILLKALATGLLCAASAQAGSYTNTFNATTSTNGFNFGGSEWDGMTASTTGGAAWIPSGGAGPIGGTLKGPVLGQNNDGYLQVCMASTDCTNSGVNTTYITGGVLFNDFDNGLTVAGFDFECDMRIGNGSQAPADGFSVNYVRSTDPIVTALAAGSTFPDFNNKADTAGNGGHWSDNGGSDISLAEEGATTGLGVGFDMWDSGLYTIPPVSPGVGLVAPGSGLTYDEHGLDIRVDNVLIASIPMPNGTTQTAYDDQENTLTQTDTAGTNAPTDPTAIETGPYDGTGCAYSLSWVHLKVTLDPSTKLLNVYWKNTQILTNFATTFFPSQGRLLFGARVGGNTANIGVDNVQITTYPQQTVSMGNFEATLFGGTVEASDSGNSVADTNTVKIVINGTNNVLPDVLTKVNGITTIGWAWWNGSAPYAIGSTQMVTVSINDTNGATYSFTTAPLVVPTFATLPPSMGVTNVNTGQPGFNVHMYHVTVSPLTTSQNYTDNSGVPLQQWENSVRRAEEEMAGLLGANDDALAGGLFIEPATINFSINTNSTLGDFSTNNGYADKPFPGINNALTVEDESVDNFAGEFTTIIDFPEAGLYAMTFNSDDGFRMTAGNPANDRFNGLQLSQVDAGRGAADTTVVIYVPSAGYYPMRTIYFQGGGGAGAEWSAQELAPHPGSFALVNDSTQPTALKSYRSSSSAVPAAVTFTDPVVGSGTYQPNWPIMAQITDGTAGAVSAAALYLNGAPVTAVVSKSGAVTTLAYTNANLLPPGANSFSVSYKDAGGTLYSNAVPFTVDAYTVIPASMALPASGVDTTKSGFDDYTYKYEGYVDSNIEYGLQNSVMVSEMELHNLIGWPNGADFTVNWMFNGPGNTNYIETSVINYQGATGNAAHYGDANNSMPGIPPQVWTPYPPGTNITDNNGPGQNDYIVDVRTVLALTPGYYTMDVNSDDGFSVSVGNPAEWRSMRLILGEADYGKGTSDINFNFWVTTAGLYPFECLYFEGGGGNSLEWDQVIAYPGNNLHVLVNDTTASMIGPSGNALYVAAVAYQYPFGKVLGPPYIASYGPSQFHPTDGAAGVAHPTHVGYDAPIWANIVDGDTAVTPASVQLWVNGAQVSPTVSKTGNTTSVKYAPASNWTVNSTNTVSLVFLDRTATWSFMVENHPNATFFIEAEDVDSGGKSQAAASIMPYWGGAYAGMPATLDVDYHRANQTDGPWYRVANDSSIATAAPLNPNIPMQFNGDLDRGVNELQGNFRIGWIGSGQWYNYTRTFPPGKYNIYGGLSNGSGAGTGAHSRYAVVQLVTSTTTNTLGIFDGLATGTWGQNGGPGAAGGQGLLPLSDGSGNMVSVDLSGAQTVRVWFPTSGDTATIAGTPVTLQNGNGDWDFLMFTPATATAPAPTLSFARVSGQLVITFTGTLSSAPTVNGTYKDITGATSPYTVPEGTPTSFFRSHN